MREVGATLYRYDMMGKMPSSSERNQLKLASSVPDHQKAAPSQASTSQIGIHGPAKQGYQSNATEDQVTMVATSLATSNPYVETMPQNIVTTTVGVHQLQQPVGYGYSVVSTSLYCGSSPAQQLQVNPYEEHAVPVLQGGQHQPFLNDQQNSQRSDGNTGTGTAHHQPDNSGIQPIDNQTEQQQQQAGQQMYSSAAAAGGSSQQLLGHEAYHTGTGTYQYRPLYAYSR
jgi:hypothetical protein